MVLDARPAEGTLGDFLARLAARSATPAGGSVAAVCTAQAAALVAMVARYCQDAALVEDAEAMLARAVRLAAEDEEAFGAVAAAWAQPAADPAEKQVRRAAVEAALLGAAEPQARIVETAAAVLTLVDRVGPRAHGGLRADLAAASDAACAGSAIASRNVATNLSSLPDSGERTALLQRIETGDETGRA